MNITEAFADEQFKAYVLEKFCGNNELTHLDVSNHVKRKALDSGFNRIRDLDISRNARLTKLECCWNRISTLQLEHKTAQ